MRSASQQGIDGSSWYLLDQETQELQGGRICPVQVFKDEEDWLSLCQFKQDSDDAFERLLTLPLWRKVERGVAIIRYGERKQRSKQRNGFFQWQPILAQCLLKPLYFLFWRSILSPLQSTLKQVSNGLQRSMLIIRRTTTLPPGMGFTCYMVFK